MNRVNHGGHNLITLTAAGAGTTNGADMKNPGCRGVQVTVDITAIGGTPTLTVTIQGKDRVSGKYYTLLASAALGSVATTVLRVFPGAAAAANTIANDQVPEDWRVIAVVAGTTPSVTATIGACLIV